MSVVVKTDKAKWKSVVEGAAELATYALAEQMLTDSEKFVPYSGGSIQSAGNLREQGRVDRGQSGEFYLVWDTVYALYQWFGVRADGTHAVKHYTTPGTGKQWVETARGKYKEHWADIAQKKFSEGLK